MAISNIKVTFSCDVKTVWDIVTSLNDYSWRSDLSKIVRAKKIFTKPFVGLYLKKQQATYIQDLKKALENLTN